jgi:mRNA interferase HigB
LALENSQNAKYPHDYRSLLRVGPLTVRVISRKKLLEAAGVHADLAAPLEVWYRIAKRADWDSLEDVRRELPSADGVEKYTVFNIKGGNYRLISEINYLTKMVFIREVLTHDEYDRERWKK